MRTITVFETASELIRAFIPTRCADDTEPFVPSDVCVHKLSDGTLTFEGNSASKFEIVGFDYDDLVNECFKRCGIRVSS